MMDTSVAPEQPVEHLSRKERLRSFLRLKNWRDEDTPLTVDVNLVNSYLKRFDADEVEVLQKIFKELALRCSKNGINKETFLQFIRLPGLWGERLFSRFDYKGIGFIDYEEWLVGIARICRSTPNEKILTIFQICDLDNDGVLRKNELVSMLSNIPNLETYLSDKYAKIIRGQTALPTRMRNQRLPDSMALRAERLNRLASKDSYPAVVTAYGDDRRYVEMPSSSSTPSVVRRQACSDGSGVGMVKQPSLRTTLGSRGEGGHRDSKDDLNGFADHISGMPPHSLILEPTNFDEETPANYGHSDEPQQLSVDSLVFQILDEYGHTSDSALTYAEFKAWIDANPSVAKLFTSCLHEEVWGLQGSALYRRHRPSMMKGNGDEDGRKRAKRDSWFVSDLNREEKTVTYEDFLRIRTLFTSVGITRRARDVTEKNAQAGGGAAPPTDGSPPEHGPAGGAAGGAGRRDDDFQYVRQAQRDDLSMILQQGTSQPSRSMPQPSSNIPPPAEAPAAPADEAGDASEAGKAAAAQALMRCPSCNAPLLLCPYCNRSSLELKLIAGKVMVECAGCTPEGRRCFMECWHCLWPFSKALDMTRKHQVKMEGILMKVGRHSSVWRRRYRYYTLVDNMIYYYCSVNDETPRGIIFLEGCFVEEIRPSESRSILAPFRKATKFGFTICTPGPQSQSIKRDLYAASEEERKLWFDALRVSTNQQKSMDELYILKGRIGQGKFSVVYRAIHRTTGEEYAIKVIQKARISTHERELLRSEMAILKLVRHKHVIHIKEILDAPTALYIVMELVPGGELYDRLHLKHRLPETEVNQIITQLLRTVSYLHSCGIVHRDLKPENILLSRKGDKYDVKIADFGLSCISGPQEKLTQPCGTIAYVAPEVLTLQGYDNKVDVWAIGVLMYLLLRGRLPFPVNCTPGGPPMLNALQQGKFQGPSFEGPVWEGISSSAKDLIVRMLQPDPKHRVDTAQALAHVWIKNPTAAIGPAKDIADLGRHDGTVEADRNIHASTFAFG